MPKRKVLFKISPEFLEPNYIPVPEANVANWNNIVGLQKPEDNATYGAINLQAFLGNGADGDVIISSNTTLTADKYYNNLTVNSGFILNSGGYRIFVKGTLTNNGTISIRVEMEERVAMEETDQPEAEARLARLARPVPRLMPAVTPLL